MVSLHSCVLLLVISLGIVATTATRLGSRAQPVESEDSEFRVDIEKRGRRLALNCDYPELENYMAKISLTTYSEVKCTTREMDVVADAIELHWGKYVAYNSVLGPLDLRSGQVCSARRRNLGSNETDHQIVSHRKMLTDPNFIFKTNGQCRYCPLDNSDRARRRLVSVPVTFLVNTDDFPGEMSYTILDGSGNTVVKQAGFTTRKGTKVLTYQLNQGQTYTLVMQDTFGDGWCCKHGMGGIRIYDGTYSNGMDIIKVISGEIQFGHTETFTVPMEGVTARSAGYENVADILYPELETGLSNWLSYYLQQEFKNKKGHCLKGNFPLAWVDIQRGGTGTGSC